MGVKGRKAQRIDDSEYAFYSVYSVAKVYSPNLTTSIAKGNCGRVPKPRLN